VLEGSTCTWDVGERRGRDGDRGALHHSCVLEACVATGVVLWEWGDVWCAGGRVFALHCLGHVIATKTGLMATLSGIY